METEEPKIRIEVGVETGEVSITSVGGKLTEYREPPVDIMGVVDTREVSILLTKSSPG